MAGADPRGDRPVNRRLAQRPGGEVDQEPWRHSLMAVGHDPWRDAPEGFGARHLGIQRS